MRAQLLILAVVLLPLLSSCDDDVIMALPSRYVYFVDQAGALQRYDITLKKVENMQLSGVTRVTPVAANGIVLFETEPGRETRLWGYCEDGSTVPVPMPVTSGPAEEYIYGAGGAALSREGHHAAWSMYRRPAGSTDTTEWTQELCRYDCVARTMKKVDVTSFVRDQFAGSNFVPDIVIVRGLLISDDGTQVMVAVDMNDIQAGTVRAAQSLLLSWEGDALALMQGNRSSFRILSFNADCSTLYYAIGQRSYAMDCSNGAAVTKTFATDHYDMLRPGAFTQATGEYLASYGSSDLLALVRIDGGEKSSVLTTIRDLTAYYPEIIYGELQYWASVSPDGAWVVFCWMDDSTEHLFVMRRDGSDLRRIGQGRFPVPATVSDVIPL